MQLYEDDFAKEREAREKTITKLGEQHQLNGELRKRVENLERDKKELRVQLNQHAAQQFQAEFAEVCGGDLMRVQWLMTLLAVGLLQWRGTGVSTL